MTTGQGKPGEVVGAASGGSRSARTGLRRLCLFAPDARLCLFAPDVGDGSHTTLVGAAVRDAVVSA